MNSTTSEGLNSTTIHGQLPNVSTANIIGFSLAFFIVGLTGIVGNALVIYVILADKKMRQSMTNMLIINLAIADGIVLVFGIPEIVQFMLNRGWILGEVMCRLERTLLVVGLYVSVMTLVSLCIERYIAIIFPIKAHLMCTRRHTLIVIVVIWTLSIGCGSPTLLFNQVIASDRYQDTVEFCQIILPGHGVGSYILYKYVEATLFYFIPLIIQVICYIVIGKTLFIGVEELHGNGRQNVDHKRLSDALKRRRAVVKMLIASVLIYFLSYSPHQILLVYNTFRRSSFQDTWVYLVFVTILAYVNSAANPILYCIFSQNFRSHFAELLLCCFRSNYEGSNSKNNVITLNSEYTILLKRNTQNSKVQYGISDV
ncbi:neuropeptide receptor 15-like [Ylistrum balloti]|uniref:neuropeptide receptor 15-like n=1 Tax=Ylistrum balloti TaxID=509963 RepID=UPI002905C5F7|nr:neuropeptide receptor 15-like [Ylistrum balloti]